MKRQQIHLDRAIADAPLHEPYVSNFKKTIGDAWKLEAKTRRIFRQFENAVHVNEQGIELKYIGHRIFYEKGKTMFTEENYQMVSGMDSMGGEIGRWEDNYFFSTIWQTESNKVSGASVLEVLNEALTELKKKQIIPSLILLDPKYRYKDEKFLKSDRFVSKMNKPHPKNELAQDYIGTYDGIPVYAPFGDLAKNLILVCNFSEAFQMLYKTNSKWYDDVLNVDVSVVTDEEAQRQLEENRAKWTTLDESEDLSDEEALLLIKTSINIDIGTIIEFKVLNKEAYIIGFLKSENEDNY